MAELTIQEIVHKRQTMARHFLLTFPLVQAGLMCGVMIGMFLLLHGENYISPRAMVVVSFLTILIATTRGNALTQDSFWKHLGRTRETGGTSKSGSKQKTGLVLICLLGVGACGLAFYSLRLITTSRIVLAIPFLFLGGVLGSLVPIVGMKFFRNTAGKRTAIVEPGMEQNLEIGRIVRLVRWAPGLQAFALISGLYFSVYTELWSVGLLLFIVTIVVLVTHIKMVAKAVELVGEMDATSVS